MSEPVLSVISELLLDLVHRYGNGRHSLVMGGDAALPNAMPDGAVFLPTDIREREAATVRTVSTAASEVFAQAFIPVPQDRSLLRSHLLIAADAVQPGGTIFVCGANATGGKSAIKDAADLFGTPQWSGYREKHRMAIFTRGEVLTPGWAMEPGIAPGTWGAFSVDTPAGELHLETRAGVFAGAKLDAGTRLLLENLDIAPGASVLDIGCGVGVIGIMASRMGAGAVTLTDANLLAVEASQRNITKIGITTAQAIASDVYSHLGDRRFDLIVSNPPFHQGKQVDFSVANQIIDKAPQHLNPGGSLLLVANAFLAYGKQMERVFTHVETITATPQYHVLRAC